MSAEMVVVPSRNGVPIRLTEERWQHILYRHREMNTQQVRVLETVAAPDTIQQGQLGEFLAARFYPETPLTCKFLVVVYREVSLNDGFVLTAYLTSRLAARRTVVWKR